VALPEDTEEPVREWTEKEDEKARIMEGIAAFNKNLLRILEAME
jgi:hypothetical protein